MGLFVFWIPSLVKCLYLFPFFVWMVWRVFFLLLSFESSSYILDTNPLLICGFQIFYLSVTCFSFFSPSLPSSLPLSFQSPHTSPHHLCIVEIQLIIFFFGLCQSQMTAFCVTAILQHAWNDKILEMENRLVVLLVMDLQRHRTNRTTYKNSLPNSRSILLYGQLWVNFCINEVWV